MQREILELNLIERYFQYITILIDIAHLDLLLAIWQWSLHLGRVGVDFRARIEVGLQTITQRNGLPLCACFEQVIEHHEEKKYGQASNFHLSLLSYVEEGNLPAVKVCINHGADNWPRALSAAAGKGNLRLVKFLREKLKEDTGWCDRNCVTRYVPIPGQTTAVEGIMNAFHCAVTDISPTFDVRYSSIAVGYSASASHDWRNAEKEAAKIATKAGHQEVADYLLNNL